MYSVDNGQMSAMWANRCRSTTVRLYSVDLLALARCEFLKLVFLFYAHGFSNFKLTFCNLLLPELIVERCFQSNLGVDLYKVHWNTFRDSFRPHQKDIITDVVSDLMRINHQSILRS